MTRETKIGLLVGLAFIIVIGILLSDHVRNTMEPPQAALAGAGNSVRQGVSAPGTSRPPVTVVPPSNVEPDQAVQTPRELDPVLPVTPSSGNTRPAPSPVVTNNTPSPAQPESPANAGSPGNDAPASNDPIASEARAHGEEIVPVTPGGQQVAQNNTPAQSQQQQAVPAGMKEYKAGAGDSVSRMAARFLGSNTKTNRELIIKANPSLQQEPHMVVIGKTYLIPTRPGGDTAQAQAPAPAAENSKSSDTADASAPTAPGAMYVVKDGDSLWKIAKEQCGTTGAMDAIIELNKDKLKGDKHDQVVVGQKLRLPGKTVASAN